MWIGHWLKALIAPREGQLLAFVGRAGPDNADDGNETVNLAHVAHSAEAGHRRAFDMMDGPRIAAGNHLPHVVVAPRFGCLRVAQQQAAIGFVPRNTPVQVHFDSALGEHRFYVAHCRQTALR